MIRVLVVDDHPLILNGLVALLNRQQDMQVCAEAANERDAEKAIGDSTPDVVLLDLVIDHADGIETIKEWRCLHPDLRILVLSAQDEAVYAERVLKAGARGYIMKRQAADEVLTAIRTVHGGELYVSRQVAARVMGGRLLPKDTPPSDIAHLTDRELHILQLIGTGLVNRQIAAELNLSVKTIESHRENIKNKLGLSDAAALRARAIRWVREGR